MTLREEGSWFFFSSRRRHTRCSRDWSSDVCSSDLADPCPICTDPTRASDGICVVEEPADLLAVERAREFRGRYHRSEERRVGKECRYRRSPFPKKTKNKISMRSQY